MCNIAELSVLLRCEIALPVNFKLATEEFRDGWKFARTTNAKRLEQKILNRGWNFIKIADASLRSGIGDTSQEAIAGALKLALREVSGHFNAVEVAHIELTQYPWFFLAKVRVCPYRIQQDAVVPVPDGPLPFPATQSKKLPRSHPPNRLLQFRSDPAMLKPLLVLTQSGQRKVG
jgi:hypothetical protein